MTKFTLPYQVIALSSKYSFKQIRRRGEILATEFGVQPFELAKQAELLGFESFFVPEHSHMPVSTVFPLGDEVPLPYKSMYDPFVTLGAVAAVTSKILGLPPYARMHRYPHET